MSNKKVAFRFHLNAFLLTVYLIISGVLLAFSSGGMVVNFRALGFNLMSGTQRGINTLTTFFSGTITAINELSELKQRYDVLETQLKDYELLQRTNANIILENERLKSLLGFSESLSLKNIPAEIIGRDPNNLYSGITINRGIKHGIKKNMPVISFQGSNIGLVGKIVQVGRNTSMIMPIYDYQCFVSARLETSRYMGLINGRGTPEATLVMKYLKKRARDEIRMGDKVVASGENYNYPKNMLIGFVSGIRALDYETSIELDIEPIIDFSRLENIFVLDIATLAEEVD